RCKPRKIGSKYSSPAVAHAPDGAVAVFADEEAAVFRDRDADGATPDFAVGRNEASHKILVLAVRFSGRMIERHPYEFVTGAFHTIPRPVERGEDVPFVFGRELVAGVKTQVEGGRVRHYEHIGNDDLVGELGMFSFVARILMIADVKPWPTIEPAGAHAA